MTEENRTLDGELHDLSVVTQILTRSFDAYFSGEIEPEFVRSWESKVASVRRVLCERVNSTLDLHDGRADGRGLSPRGFILLSSIEVDLAQFGVVPAEDGKLFTYKTGKEAPSDGEGVPSQG
ncbi:hypothetical protein AB0F25_30375 [Streptomyces wedmorensis]|uniref:hypothetical protein n=1 Tax=Streptomyces wedmorensis TaxID=43759 RepID=UPI00341F55A0